MTFALYGYIINTQYEHMFVFLYGRLCAVEGWKRSGIGFSCASCIHSYIKRMAESGKLEINGKRGVSTEKQRMDIVRMPVIGYVACGSPDISRCSEKT